MSAAAVATAVLSLAPLASLLALAVCSALLVVVVCALVAVVCAALQLLLLSSASDASPIARSTSATASTVSSDARKATSLADDVSKDLEKRTTASAHAEAKAEDETEADSTTDEGDSDSDYYRESERLAVEIEHQSEPYDLNEASSDLSASDISECDEDQDEDQDEDDEHEYGKSHNYDDNYHYDYHYNYDCESDADSENEECLSVQRKLNFDDISLNDVGEEEEEEPKFVTPVTPATAVAPVPAPATDPEELRYANNPKVLADYRDLVASFRAACAEHELNQRREFQLRHFVSQGRHRCDGSSVMISSNNNLEQPAAMITTSLPAVTQRRDTRFISLGRRHEEKASKTAPVAGVNTIATSAPTMSKQPAQTRAAKATVRPRWR